MWGDVMWWCMLWLYVVIVDNVKCWVMLRIGGELGLFVCWSAGDGK